MNVRLFFVLVCAQMMTVCDDQEYTQHHITILMITNNARSYVQTALDSVFSQQYQNYTLLVIDDCSGDDTVAFIKEYAQEKGHEHRVVVHKNKVQRMVPLINYFRAVKVSDSEDIMLVLNPQDRLAHDEVLADVNNVYQSDDVWMTYGPMRSHPSCELIHNMQIPPEVVYLRGYRDCLNIPMHLHTFRSLLFKKITVRDLCHEGEFLKLDTDIAALLPMLEMAQYHVRRIPDVWMVRNAQLDHHRYIAETEYQETMDVMVRCWGHHDELEVLEEERDSAI